MEFVDEVLYEFSGQLRYEDILKMTYKELGYLRAHRKKHHPPEADMLARGLMGAAGGMKQ